MSILNTHFILVFCLGFSSFMRSSLILSFLNYVIRPTIEQKRVKLKKNQQSHNAVVENM